MRALYSDTIESFLNKSELEIVGLINNNFEFSSEILQKKAWTDEISILQNCLKHYSGSIYFEFSIPRMGKRIDVILIIESVIFVLEFKVGEKEYRSGDIDQVWDYALDLKNFHEGSHHSIVAPILICTRAKKIFTTISTSHQNDNLLFPILTNSDSLNFIIDEILNFSNEEKINTYNWESSRYSPTPSIVEAAMALYRGHNVKEISRSDASAINLEITSNTISEIIKISREKSQKSICFVTGVPGAGKTLVGLNIATQNINKDDELYSVFLSGNGPLVAILREALTRDKIQNQKLLGKKLKKYEVMSEVKMFIQNVHNFRDDCLNDLNKPPIEHVAIFDEAQRAWNKEKTSLFMRQKKNKLDFDYSEPEFLISCLDRHANWAVIVCLVGGGQEINTGEAGISEWIDSLNRSYPDWNVYLSSKITDSEYGSVDSIKNIKNNKVIKDELHLSVSVRSFRAENVSLLIKQILDLNIEEAKKTLPLINNNFPIVLTRDIEIAKKWLKEKARGSERYGIIVSSKAERLKPHAIDVKSPMNPIHWFLEGKDHVHSSYFLEDVATEFSVQGLELDWTCVTWDADFRYKNETWDYWSFRGNKWQKIHKPDIQKYLKNAYRVLLTRARQGMIIVIPKGNDEDKTRNPEFYNATFNLLKSIGFQVLE